MYDRPQGEHLPVRLWWVLAELALVWGCNWTAMKLAITEIAPFTFRTLCLGAGSGILFAVLRATGQPLASPRREWPRLAPIALFNITAWNLLVVPVVGVLSGMLFLGETPGWPEFTALALVLGSLATVIVPQKRNA